MDRRRFLKYAAGTGVAVGASALGLDYLRYPFQQTNQVISSSSVAKSTTSSSQVASAVTETQSSTAASTSASTTGPLLVWESNFKDGTLDGFSSGNVDLSVGCENNPPQKEDVLAYVVPDNSAPAGTGYSLELLANPINQPALFVNAISGRQTVFTDGNRWRLSGWFRNVSEDTGMIDLALQLVDGYKEYSAEIDWILFKGNSKSNQVFARHTTENDPKFIHLLDLPIDQQWHYAELELTYDESRNIRRLEAVRFDNASFVVGEDIPPHAKQWMQSFTVLLETQDGYVCESKRASQGKSRWSKVRLEREPM
jgi:hypothetical protein